MIGKIIGAVVGRRIAQRSGSGAGGAVAGILVPIVARRAFGPLGLALGGAYAAKKIYDGRKKRRTTDRY
jgi:hypothetical protein